LFVKHLNSENYKDEVLNSEVPWFVNFGTDECEECKAFIKEYDKAAKYEQGRVKFGYVNLNQHKDIADFWSVKDPNTIIFFGSEKPSPKGNPLTFNWKPLAEDLQNFADNEET